MERGDESRYLRELSKGRLGMQNDDKRTSRDDETFPHEAEAEADAAHEDELTSPEPPLEAAAEPKEDAAKTISFPKTAHMGGQGPLEPTFGMPDFDFPRRHEEQRERG